MPRCVSRAVDAAILSLLLAAAATAQTSVSAWPEVKLTVFALDANGNPLQGLAAESFQIREDNKPAKITGVKLAAEPMSICLLIDSSGSMYDRRNEVQAAATRLLNALPLEDEVCVADFSSETFTDVQLTKNRPDTLKALTFIKNSGGSAMYDAIIAVSAYLRTSARNPGRAFVLLTDADDNASHAKYDDVRKALETPGSPSLYLIAMPSPHPNSAALREQRSAERAALDLAQLGGGFAFFPRDQKESEANVDLISDLLASRYVLSFEAVNPVPNGRERRITVELDKVHQRAKASVRAPEGFYAPSQ